MRETILIAMAVAVSTMAMIVTVSYIADVGVENRAQINREICRNLQMDRLEDETKWHEQFGCLVKRGDKWAIR